MLNVSPEKYTVEVNGQTVDVTEDVKDFIEEKTKALTQQIAELRQELNNYHYTRFVKGQ